MAFANVAAGQTDSVVVTGITRKSILVLGVAAMTAGTATNVTFNSKGSGSGTAISPLFALPINGSVVLPISDQAQGYWFKTNVGEALTVTTGAGATTGILITYSVV